MSTPSHTPPSIVTEAATFIGIDYHKKYSVYETKCLKFAAETPPKPEPTAAAETTAEEIPASAS